MENISDIADIGLTVKKSTRKNNNKPILKSVNDRRCLTACYPKNTDVVHPTALDSRASTNISTCAIDPTYDRELMRIMYYDECRVDDNAAYSPPDTIEAFLNVYSFNAKDFLRNIYALTSFENVIDWTLDNDHKATETIKRVHNCAWKVFGVEYTLIPDKVFDYYYELLSTKWIKSFYNVLKQTYAFNLTLDNKLHIEKKGSINDGNDRLYETILFYYFSRAFFRKVVKKYTEVYKEQWIDIDNHYNNLKDFCLKYLIYNLEHPVTKTG